MDRGKRSWFLAIGDKTSFETSGNKRFLQCLLVIHNVDQWHFFNRFLLGLIQHSVDETWYF